MMCKILSHCVKTLNMCVYTFDDEKRRLYQAFSNEKKSNQSRDI